jgi:L-ribulose-5-phosphate 3-epimerase UlaE
LNLQGDGGEHHALGQAGDWKAGAGSATCCGAARLPANGQNLPWGTGDTPLVQILQTVRKNRWKMPATIELEYEVPGASDAVREVVKCREFCERALA